MKQSGAARGRHRRREAVWDRLRQRGTASGSEDGARKCVADYQMSQFACDKSKC